MVVDLRTQMLQESNSKTAITAVVETDFLEGEVWSRTTHVGKLLLRGKQRLKWASF